MRIVLIHAKINFDNMEPYGLLALGTYLTSVGHSVLVLDFFPGDSMVHYKRIKNFDPQLVGYSIETPAFGLIKACHKILKETFPKALYCAGGSHTSACPEETLRQLFLDFVIKGEAEKSLAHAIDTMEKGNDLNTVPGVGYLSNNLYQETKAPSFVENLDTLPIVDRSLIPDYPFYLQPPGNIRGLVIPRTANMMTSRGCYNGCIFCDSHNIHGRTIRQRSVSHVMQEIELLIRNYKAQALFFIDDIFTHDKQWMLQFCQEMSDHFPKMKWGCQSRADCLDEELISHMKRAGCKQIDIGVESGDPKVLQKLGKGERREDFIFAAKLIHQYKLRMLCSFVIGAPNETWGSIEQTKALIRKMAPSMCQYFTLIPYPGTALDRMAQKKQWYEKVTYTNLFSQKQWDRGFLTCGLSPKEQMVAKKKLQRMTAFHDHKTLIYGWFRHPRFIFLFLWLFIKRGFFLKTMVRSIKEGNTIFLFHTIYTNFNQFLLYRLRQKVQN